MEQPVLVKIDRLSKKGRGIGRFGNGDVEVIGALPTEDVLALLGRKRRGVCKGKMVSLATRSSQRVIPRCPHAPECGGCSLQHLDYQAQLVLKQEVIEKLYPGAEEIIPSPSPWHYRNKMEFSFSQNKAGEKFLGLMIGGSKGRVLNLRECHLTEPWVWELLERVRKWWEDSGLMAYRFDDTGSLRTLTVRQGIRTGEKMVFLTVSGNPEYRMSRTQMERFVQAVGEMSVFVRIHQICKGMQTQFYELHLAGSDHIHEELIIQGRRYRFKISPTSFFQPNTLQAERLYEQALEMNVSKPKRVLDLYAGTATLGILFAATSESVTSIELNPHACFDAKVNAEMNGVDNLKVVCGDVAEVLEGESADLALVDPPRSGLDEKALAALIKLQPYEILYISCNPQTQATNVSTLLKVGYQIKQVQPVDQFPHTVHVENIVLLSK